MTRDELKQLISECIVEENARIEEENTFFEEHGEDIIREAYADLYIEENTDESDDDYLYEGANLDSRAIFKAGKQEYKAQLKTIKGALKSGDTAAAKKAIAEAKKGLDEMEKGIKACESNAGSAILGYFARNLVTVWETLLPSLGITAGIGAASGAIAKANPGAADNIKAKGATVNIFANYVPGIVSNIKDLKQVVDNTKDEDLNTADKFNLYKAKLLRYCKDLRKNLDKIEQKIK